MLLLLYHSHLKDILTPKEADGAPSCFQGGHYSPASQSGDLGSEINSPTYLCDPQFLPEGLE